MKRIHWITFALFPMLCTGCMKPRLVSPANLLSPTITKVIPSSGSSEKSTDIAILGSGFIPGARIQIGSVDCSNVQFISENAIYCTAPPQRPSRVTTKVINPNQNSAELPDSYAYVESWVPVSGFVLSSGGGVTRGSKHIATQTLGEGIRPVILKSANRTLIIGSEAIQLNGSR